MSVTEVKETGNQPDPTTTPPSQDLKPGGWIDSWFDHLPFADRWPAALLARVGELEPVRVEQYREGGELVIRAEMPGIENEEDIEVSVTGDKLTVSAKREQRSESEEDGTFRSEFRYGSFSRTITVPPGTDADDIAASYNNGIVDVRVQVDDEPVEPRKIKVSRG